MADPETPLEIADELRSIVGRLVRGVRARSDTLSPRLAAVLGYLSREGPMTTSALASRQQVRHQSMAATVKELEDRGYVERRPDPSDGRSTLITIGPGGEARLDEERTRRLAWFAEIIEARLSRAEQRQLGACLPLIERLIDEPDEA
jgi:DNA-binding MarR family transcriptional regulator